MKIAFTLEQTREDSRECQESQVATAEVSKQWCDNSNEAPGGR